jgi:hypothetical protein
MEKYTTVVTNKNEITKSEFDELDKINDFDRFTPKQVAMAAANIHSLIKKGGTEELSPDELDLIKSGTAELNNLTKYTINEMITGRICKSDVYVQPKQVMWEDTLEKSTTGETIKKGIFLDTPLNRELDRVGDEIIKGKKISKNGDSEKDDMSEEDRKTMHDSEMYKAMMDCVKKGEGSDSGVMMKSMSEKYPDEDKGKIKKYMNQVYKSVSKTYMEKANDYANMSKDDDENNMDSKSKGQKK